MKKTEKNISKKRKSDDFIDESTLSHEEYYEGIEIDKEVQEEIARRKRNKNLKRIIIAIFVMFIAITIFVNKDNFTADNLQSWIQTTVTGTIDGDGYPVSITGSVVSENNIITSNENIAVISDTALTINDSTGKELLNYRHSFSEPAINEKNGYYIIYSIGGTSFTVINDDFETTDYTTTDKITVCDISSSGRYAVVTQPIDYNSNFSVYTSSGNLKFSYDFANGFITDIKLDDDGETGVVSVVDSKDGVMYTQIYMFDFDLAEPIAQYTSENNIISQISYNSGVQFYFIGNNALVRSNGMTFEEFDYEGRSITAVSKLSNKTIISLTSYSGDGPCSVYIFDNSITPKVIETETKVNALSGFGSVVSILTNDVIYAYDSSCNLIGTCEAGYDAKSFVMPSSKSVYVLGIREIRMYDIT